MKQSKVFLIKILLKENYKNNSSENINTVTKSLRKSKISHENSSKSHQHTKSIEGAKIEKAINAQVLDTNSEFPHNDKYNLILENSRALKREIKNMDHDLDNKEMELEMDIQNIKQQKINTDKDLVDNKFKIFMKILKCYNKCLGKINEKLHPI